METPVRVLSKDAVLRYLSISHFVPAESHGPIAGAAAEIPRRGGPIGNDQALARDQANIIYPQNVPLPIGLILPKGDVLHLFESKRSISAKSIDLNDDVLPLPFIRIHAASQKVGQKRAASLTASVLNSNSRQRIRAD